MGRIDEKIEKHLIGEAKVDKRIARKNFLKKWLKLKKKMLSDIKYIDNDIIRKNKWGMLSAVLYSLVQNIKKTEQDVKNVQDEIEFSGQDSGPDNRPYSGEQADQWDWDRE